MVIEKSKRNYREEQTIIIKKNKNAKKTRKKAFDV